MQTIDRLRLGTTNVAVTRLGFGGAPLGGLYRAISNAESEATLEAAWTAGIRFFDTAPWYGRGLSEHRVGAYLRDTHRKRTRSRPRSAVFSVQPVNQPLSIILPG
jgi:D-threo-aldose 1-dehydrogenase